MDDCFRKLYQDHLRATEDSHSREAIQSDVTLYLRKKKFKCHSFVLKARCAKMEKEMRYKEKTQRNKDFDKIDR